jgi:hypothetical protein
MLYPQGSHHSSSQGIQVTSWSAKVRRITGTSIMALKLSTSSTNIRRNQRNSNAKFAITPHRRSKVMVEQTRERNYWKLGRPHKAIYEQLQVDIQAASINRRSQSVCETTRRNTAGIHPKMESYQKFSSRSFRRKSNRCVHYWIKAKRPSQRDGQNQAKNSVRPHGRSKQICRWRRRMQQQADAIPRGRQKK